MKEDPFPLKFIFRKRYLANQQKIELKTLQCFSYWLGQINLALSLQILRKNNALLIQKLLI